MTRDYKARRAAPLDSRRLRDFGAGALAGIAITALACIALNVALQRESARAAGSLEVRPRGGAMRIGTRRVRGICRPVAVPQPGERHGGEQRATEEAVAELAETSQLERAVL